MCFYCCKDPRKTSNHCMEANAEANNVYFFSNLYTFVAPLHKHKLLHRPTADLRVSEVVLVQLKVSYFDLVLSQFMCVEVQPLFPQREQPDAQTGEDHRFLKEYNNLIRREHFVKAEVNRLTTGCSCDCAPVCRSLLSTLLKSQRCRSLRNMGHSRSFTIIFP